MSLNKLVAKPGLSERPVIPPAPPADPVAGLFGYGSLGCMCVCGAHPAPSTGVGVGKIPLLHTINVCHHCVGMRGTITGGVGNGGGGGCLFLFMLITRGSITSGLGRVASFAVYCFPPAPHLSFILPFHCRPRSPF